ncbi:MAG: iron-sulfur cluster carrier protein ApbC [Porticoccaceae bacterium]
MATITEQSVYAALGSILDPVLQRDYISLNGVDNLAIVDSRVRLTLKLGYPAASMLRKIALHVEAQLQLAGFDEAEVNIVTNVVACPSQSAKGHLAGIKNIISVASGKGGVGKSTTAVNLALALHAEGARVGILDADIYGPSQRTMLGVADDVKPQLVDEKYLKPVVRMGIKSMSVGYLSEEKAPMIWRGPMATRMLSQLMEQTLWGELDYLVIDMPPGTGDIQISLAQKISVSGAVIVSTPQQVALIDARKGIEMFNKVGIPVLGIAENMATHICSNCGHEESIFGAHGAQAMAEEYQVALLGSLPLDSRIREDVDHGSPTVAADPAGPLAAAYTALSHQVSAQLWQSNLATVESPEIVMLEE